MPNMSKSFQFTRKNKNNLIQSFLADDCKNIRDPRDIPTFISQKMNREVKEFEQQVND